MSEVAMTTRVMFSIQWSSIYSLYVCMHMCMNFIVIMINNIMKSSQWNLAIPATFATPESDWISEVAGFQC